MKRVKLEGRCRVRIEDVPTPEPEPGHVLVATAVSALCGSELGAYRGDGVGNGNTGHEAVGTVAACGEGVDSLREGQRVGVSAIAGCGRCPACEKGQTTWCGDFSFYGNMHAEAFPAAADACFPLPDSVPWEAAVLLTGDGLGVPYHTAQKISGDDIRTVAVFGAGPIGLGNVLLQSFLGRRVIAVDLSPERLDLAARLGADTVIDARETDAVQAVREASEGGVDEAIEAAGVPETAKQCFRAVRTAGTVVFNGEQPAVELSPSEDFIRRDITAVGSWFYHFAEIPAMLDLYRSGLPVERLVTDTFPLDEAAAAYEAFAAGKTGKVLLTP